MPVERAQVDPADLLARRARVGEPGDAGRNGHAHGRVEPKLARRPGAHSDGTIFSASTIALRSASAGLASAVALAAAVRVPALGGWGPWGKVTRGSGTSNNSSTEAAECPHTATGHSLMRREAITPEPHHAAMIGRFRFAPRIGLLLPGGLSGRG
jgi:hypothetical protein